jgi:hypothetical protein
MLRVLGVFRLTAPTTAPSQLLRALLLERGLPDERHPAAPSISFVWDGAAAADMAEKLILAMYQLRVAGDAGGADLIQAKVSVASLRKPVVCSCSIRGIPLLLVAACHAHPPPP